MDLETLNASILLQTRQKYPDSTLHPIFGAGQTYQPRLMFVFINPTIRNIATHSDWQGIRAPWIGTLDMWKCLYMGNSISEHTYNQLPIQPTQWTPKIAQALYEELAERGIYCTNAVKWAGETGALPDKEKINWYRQFLVQEITLVQPRFIVTFGQIPFQMLTNKTIQLNQYYTTLHQSQQLVPIPYQHSSGVGIIPTFFPVGQGRQHQAKTVSTLRLLSTLTELDGHR